VVSRHHTHGSGWWRLDVEPGHPTFLDHPSDHVQGILLVEAAQQVAMLAGAEARAEAEGVGGVHRPAAPARLEVAFSGFAELDLPLDFHARQATGGRVALEALQQGRRLLTGSASWV
jgi:hypothetical protein